MNDNRDDWGEDLDKAFKTGLAILFIAMIFAFAVLVIAVLLTVYLP